MRIRDEMRAQMLRAAEELIRESHAVTFSVGELAARSGSSVASLYNLIGTKSTILYALLNATLDRIIMPANPSLASVDPIDAALEASRHAARVFVDDPQFLRPLYGYLLGVADPENRPTFMARSLAYWRTNLAPITTAGLLPQEISAEIFAHDHMLFFTGALDQWVQGELDNDAFQEQIRKAAIMRLLIIDDPLIRRRLLALI
jgi:AcrR family transcriptional regulator